MLLFVLNCNCVKTAIITNKQQKLNGIMLLGCLCVCVLCMGALYSCRLRMPELFLSSQLVAMSYKYSSVRMCVVCVCCILLLLSLCTDAEKSALVPRSTLLIGAQSRTVWTFHIDKYMA